jgi:hypothetical protein
MAWLAFVATVAVAPFSHAAGVLEAIDAAHREGRVSDDERILYRVTAVRAPARLPAPFRGLVQTGPPAARCQTSVLADAFQRRDRLAPAARAALDELLDPPPPLSHSVTSEAVFPFRVSYSDESLEAKAQQVLTALETSFAKEVQEWGFWAPALEPGSEYYEVFLMDPGLPGVGGYTSPYLENVATSRADTHSYIVVGDEYDGVLLASIVAHEFNHACQLAMDASEQIAFLENSASYIESAVFPAGWPYDFLMFPAFQSQPYRPLEYTAPGGTSDGYEYGGALWVRFLEHLYGADDPRFLRQIWEGSVQDGWTNEPDYFDVLDEKLGPEGGLSGAVHAFAEHRFFVGGDDDGQHLPGAEQWTGSEVWRTATWTSAQLPLVDEAPADLDTRPRPNGCNYVVLNVDGSAALPVRVSFSGAASVRWDVSVLALADDGGTSREPLAIDDQGVGALSVSLAGLDRLVLVVCQLGQDGYDPDDHQWTAGSYHYGIQWDIPAPTVAAASPTEIEQGAHGVPVIITGEGFYDHEDLAVSLSGSKVAITLAEIVSAEELRVLVTVAPNAPLGPRDVTVVNPGGAAGVGPGLISIVPAKPLPGPEASGAITPSGGCGCAVPPGSRTPPLGLPWLGAAAALGVRLAGRRRR